MSFNALPCPFCGGFAEPVTQRWGPAGLQREYHGIVCDGDCLTFFDCRAPTVADAIAAWNVRATPELLDALKDIVGNDPPTYTFASTELERCIRVARAAIARAEGK